MAKDKAASRPSHKREANRRKNGYWSRVQLRSERNIRKRFSTHMEKHPKDKVAKVAFGKRFPFG